MSNAQTKEALRIIRIREVVALTGLSRSTIYAAVKSGTFPRQVKLSIRASGWFEAEILKWVQERPRSA